MWMQSGCGQHNGNTNTGQDHSQWCWLCEDVACVLRRSFHPFVSLRARSLFIATYEGSSWSSIVMMMVDTFGLRPYSGYWEGHRKWLTVLSFCQKPPCDHLGLVCGNWHPRRLCSHLGGGGGEAWKWLLRIIMLAAPPGFSVMAGPQPQIPVHPTPVQNIHNNPSPWDPVLYHAQ